MFTIIAIATDTVFYQPSAGRSYRALFGVLVRHPSITPINNLWYNTQQSNLALHGLHPRYQHALVNLPQLLGPSLIALCSSLFGPNLRNLWPSPTGYYLTSGLSGMLLLSVLPHQEPRFLLPIVPLFLICLDVPKKTKPRRLFWISWTAFNLVMGLLMGVYHQGGVLEGQLAIPKAISTTLMSHHARERGTAESDYTHIRSTTAAATAFWWKTYPPPLYLLGNSADNHLLYQPLNITTISLMGRPFSDVQSTLDSAVGPCFSGIPSVDKKWGTMPASKAILIALPFSSLPPKYDPGITDQRWLQIDAEQWGLRRTTGNGEVEIRANLVAKFPRHLNLDDIDFEEDGIGGTIARVIGKRGLGLWNLERLCP